MGLISKKQAAAINAKAEDLGGGSDKNIPMGLNTLTMVGATGKETGSGKPAIILKWNLPGDEKFDIEEYHVIEDEDSVGAKLLAKKLQVAGKDGLIECDTIEELAAYVNKVMKGEKFQVVVKHEEYLKEKDGKIFKNTSAKVAYIGALDEELSVDPSKLLRQLEGEQLARWKEYNAQNGRGATPASKNDLAIESDDDADLDDTDDLEERIPTEKAKPVITGKAPAKKAVAKAAPVEVEEEEEEAAPAADEEDDLDLV
jgi:hypothetical protein